MGSKSIKKLVSKFDLGHQLVKKLGLPDPSGDLLYGSEKALSPAEQAQKNAMDMAKQQAAQSQQEMQMQISAANEAAAQSAQQVQFTQDRENLSNQLQEAGQITTERPTLELAGGDVAAGNNPRKKFRGQIGGASGGASVRV